MRRTLQLAGSARFASALAACGSSSSPPDRSPAISYGKQERRLLSGPGQPIRWTPHEGLSAFPAWGPSRIAFSRLPGATFADCSAPGVWTIKPDGSDAQPIIEQAPPELTMLGYNGLQPISWLGDDKLLVGARTEYGTEDAILDTKSGQLRRTRSYVVRPSSDGTLFVGGSDPDNQIVAITRVDDGKRSAS